MGHGALSNILPVLELLPPDLEGVRILDVGLGCGQVMHTIMAFSDRKTLWFKGAPYILGIDVDLGNVEFAKKWMPFYREVYLCDAVKVPYPEYISKNLRIIVCTEMVEHTFVKSETIEMIKYLKNLAPLVIFTCPNGDTLSDKHDDYETHNTVWYEQDFKELGFKTKIVNRLDFGGQELRLVSYIIKFINIFRSHNKTILDTIVAWKDDTQR